MKAKDMFEKGTYQLFNIATGERICYLRGKLFTEPEEPEPEIEIDNPNQIKLDL